MVESGKSKISDAYDGKIFDSEISFVSSRMNSEGFRYFDVEGEKKYETKDREGRKVTIFVYKEIIPKETPYILDAWYLFAVQNKKIIGYLVAHIDGYLRENELLCTGTTSYSVAKQKGKGIGGAMEKINGYMMQKWANENVELEREERDGNKEQIELALANSGLSVEKVGEMLVSRQIWLELYGINGKVGFRKKDNYTVAKAYKKGDPLPHLNMMTSQNDTPIGTMVTLIKRA